MTTAHLAEEIEDARGLLFHIEFALDNGRIDAASLYASELAEALYRARLLDLAHQPDSG